MPERITADICVIGAGAGGLTVAAGASQMGADVVLVERGRMGGDCLNHGCVPSKAMIAAARAARAVRTAGRFGVRAGPPEIDFEAVRGHVRGVVAGIAPNDSAERMEGLGVRVVRASGRFAGPGRVEAGDAVIAARRFVVATGSSPAAPPVPGLEEVPYLTNETVFENDAAPEHLVVLGGGPIGCELAQAHRRLGCRVTVVEMLAVLGKDDPELAEIVKNRLRAEGIEIREGVRAAGVRATAGGVAVALEDGGRESVVEGSHLLVAAGRSPNVDGLGLDAAGIAHDRRGVAVDDRLRTTNKKVFAIGDVAGGLQFTHVANHHAGVVIRNALFRVPARVERRAVPWVTYTDPELAHVGLSEAEARRRHGRVRVLRHPFSENDRARTELEADGLVKLVATAKGAVVGATIVGPHAGELIQSWILPVRERMKLRRLAGLVLPYPTLGEAGKRAAGAFYAQALFGDRTRGIVRLLSRLP